MTKEEIQKMIDDSIAQNQKGNDTKFTNLEKASNDVQGLIDKTVSENQKGNDTKFAALGKAIEEVNKTAEAASDSVQIEKPKKAKAPVKLTVDGKKLQAKGNSFKAINQQGGTDVINLADMSEADLKKTQKAHPTMFVEVED